MEDSPQEGTSQRPAIQRRRTAYACVSCRARKTRCDGRSPCGTCRTLDIECNYDQAVASSKGKSDLILNVMLRLESSISEIDRKVSGLQQEVTSFVSQQAGPQTSPVFLSATPGQYSTSSIHNLNDTTTQARLHQSIENHADNEFNNATISADHTSTTEAILHWPVFDAFPELRHENVLKSGAIFWMENTRHRQISRESVMPFLSDDELDRLISAFQRTANSFYPIVTQESLDEIRNRYHAHEMDFSVRTCFTLLVMSLGCAAETIANVYSGSPSDARKLTRLRSLGRIFFDAATCRLHAAYSTISVESAQCLALTALYYAYLQRPIQAWSMLSSTATACRVMAAYNTSDALQTECVRRIFWMCYILESDYLAELPALPHFGIADIESRIPLPGAFVSHEDAAQNELASLFFVGCISMRRLLNRCHHLLFGERSDHTRSSQRLHAVVTELDQQLEDWKRLLPPSLNFAVNTEPASSQHAGFLRQRYLTCRALIYRTYVMDAISDNSEQHALDQHAVEGSRRCLEACLLHILNLRPFDQTILVDVWICSLSMAGTMMVLLVAASVPTLRACLSDRVYTVGAHLISLLESCSDVHGENRSPSVNQAIEWIMIVDRILQRDYSGRPDSTSPTYVLY